MFNRLIPKPLQLIFRNSLVSINPQCLTSIDIVSNQISGHLKTSLIITIAYIQFYIDWNTVNMCYSCLFDH